MTRAVMALALRIADEQAAIDIRSHCLQQLNASGRWWRVCRDRHVSRAVRYLELRGLIERHRKDATLVRPLERSRAPAAQPNAARSPRRARSAA